MRASCINQLIYIIHEIYRVFNCSLSFEVRGIFLDLLKIFDKIWHQRILFKLESFTIRGKWLSNKFQKILLNDQESNWFLFNGGLLQGSILGLLLFLIYINALPDGIIPLLNFLPVMHHFFLLSRILMNQISISILTLV